MTPKEKVKKAYIAEFGESAYYKYSEEQLRHREWTFCKWLNTVEMNLEYCQILMMMSAAMLQTGSKAVHSQRSICAKGHFEIDALAKATFGLPWDRTEAAFVRHSYSSGLSHPMDKFVKSFSINIADKLHLLMVSTPVSGFWDLPSFKAFSMCQMHLDNGDVDKCREIIRKYPLMWEAYQACPYPTCSTYLDLVYFTCMVFDWGDHYLVRFRAYSPTQTGHLPDVRKHEMPRSEIRDFWKSKHFQMDIAHVPTTVYEDTYRQSISEKRTVQYELHYQQIPKPSNKKDLSNARNCSIPWNATWKKFGTVYVKEVVADAEVPFRPSQLFPNLYLASPGAITDTATIGDFRTRIYDTLQFMRNCCS